MNQLSVVQSSIRQVLVLCTTVRRWLNKRGFLLYYLNPSFGYHAQNLICSKINMLPKTVMILNFVSRNWPCQSGVMPML